MLAGAVDDPAQPRELSELQKPLEQFRAKTKRLTIHPLELAACWAIGAHLVFLPWALGSTRLWSQSISFALAVIGFALALLPRNYTEEHTGSNRFRLLMWPKLVRFPIFWIGLALLGLIAVQAGNPAWSYRTDGSRWWMLAIPHHEWLPVGVEAPFAKWNQWRSVMVYASAWLTACAIWVAFTRRRTVQVFLMAISFNGLLLAAFGIAQRLFGNGKIFWFYQSPNPAFFSSFIYKNHASAYLLLALAMTCGLAGWYYLRGLRRLEKSNPSGVLAFFATCIAVGVLTSYARGATLVMMAFLILCTAGFVIHQISLPSENRKPIVMVVLILVFGYFLKTGFEALQMGEAWDRLQRGLTRQDLSLESREQLTRASLEMLGEHWQRGVGAGSYRYTFVEYQHRHPEIMTADGAPIYWQEAHNDIVQIPIELGAPGMLLVAAAFLYWGFALVRSYFWETPLSACLVLGAALQILYAWWDFPFQNPAILVTWCAMWPIATMWARFEESGARS